MKFINYIYLYISAPFRIKYLKMSIFAKGNVNAR